MELALAGRAPAALAFRESEEVLTLGALVSDMLFDRPIPVLQLPEALYERLSRAKVADIDERRLHVEGLDIDLAKVTTKDIALSRHDRELLSGARGAAVQLAMQVICLMAAAEGADGLVDVTRGHIDGCILAHDANLIFAERMAGLGAQVTIPTTINAISVDRENWRGQGVSAAFGERASRLADAYVAMGARPSFTCAPYLLPDPPAEGERIGWSESNAVIYANSVLGARTPKHPDFLDLFIAMTGRAPATAVYSEEGRRPQMVLEISAPKALRNECFWPVLGWLAGLRAPDHIPLLTGLEHLAPTRDDLKALCAAFGTTSGAPMLHIAGHTPEADLPPLADATTVRITLADLGAAWRDLNRGRDQIDLVAIGSPHASIGEVRRIVDLLAGRNCAPQTQMLVTIGRDVLRSAQEEGLVDRLQACGVRLIPDLCWCSITEPVFPKGAKGLMTNSGKYAHYAHALSGLYARLGGLADCVEAAVTGRAPDGIPDWLAE